jgi:TrfA protein
MSDVATPEAPIPRRATKRKPAASPETPSIADRVASIAKNAIVVSAKRRSAEEEKQLDELHGRYELGQLVLWPENNRGVPNELVRSAIFGTRNRNAKRIVYPAEKPLVVPVIGGGQINYIGTELRQDDETLWLQLVHMAKETNSETVTFNRHSLIKALGWADDGRSYQRILTSLRRLQSGVLEIYSKRLGAGLSTQLIMHYDYSDAKSGMWQVRVFDRSRSLLPLFDRLYTRLDWATRLALPEGIATWLHGFFASHQEPYPHKLDTLYVGCGLTLETPEDALLDPKRRAAVIAKRRTEAKRLFKRALDSLIRVGFLREYSISRTGLLSVKRA